MQGFIPFIPYLIFLLIGVGVFLIGQSIMGGRGDGVRTRLDARRRSEDPAALLRSADGIPTFTIGTSELEKDLRRAGYYHSNAKARFYATRNMAATGVMLLTGLLLLTFGSASQTRSTQILFVGMVAAAVSWSLPRVLLGFRAKSRVDRICHALPDGLDMIGICMQSGIGLEDALALVSRELRHVHRDLAQELTLVRRQAEMQSIEFAFHQFARRIDGPDIINLDNLIRQGRQLGTGVAKSIRDYADALRTRRAQMLDQLSRTAGLKLLLPITLCLVPATILFLLTPAIVELFDFLRGLAETDIPPL